MLAAEHLGELGDARADFINTVGALIGKDKAASMFDAAMAKIRSEAEAGARKGVNAEIPKIESKVKTVVTPMIVGALAASGLAATLGVVAIAVARKKARAA